MPNPIYLWITNFLRATIDTIIVILSIDNYNIDRCHSQMARLLKSFIDQLAVNCCLVPSLVLVQLLYNVKHEFLYLLLFLNLQLSLQVSW